MTAPAAVRRIDLAGWVKPLGWAALVANCVLVVTGGAVRLTSSGLGCPTWPRCTDRGLTPHGELNVHSAIEFSNRLLTYPLVIIAILTFVAAWQSGRRDLRNVALLAALGIPAQAVVGGISVLTDLNPWVVSLHLVCSMAIIGLTVLFLWRVYAPAAPVVRGPVVLLAWANFAVAWLVLYAGTVVTGAGPHAGDADSPRNGLDPLQMSQVHADLVCLFIGLTVGLLIASYALKAPAATRQAAWVLLAVELAQAAIGWVQYFTDLPIVLVMFHMLGAALISAAVTWVLLRIRHAAAE
ncbi:heme A synthase [Nocardioides sp. DS6]|uniref:Heme A synthase n=1 Tax=Nocardioides eburneus TaxID=3231482 RepID=A0ABV3T111_9ACTN